MSGATIVPLSMTNDRNWGHLGCDLVLEFLRWVLLVVLAVGGASCGDCDVCGVREVVLVTLVVLMRL